MECSFMPESNLVTICCQPLGCRSLDSRFTILLPTGMRVAALILGLCLAYPAFGAPGTDNACPGMIMPPAQLREISRGFGHGHTGIDLMAPYGSPIRAAAGGVVIYAGWYFAYGKIVDIRHADGLITRYAHMSEFAPGIAPGTPVAAGEVIGQVGMTGRAHGAHVHFEVRIDGQPVDPKPYLALAPCPQSMPEPLEEARVPEGWRDR
jgi:murein DD-endopeptidase MepM/ murein hydrolase activator NlpD